MRNLLNFLARYNNLILFLLLEGIAIYLVVTGNNYHNSRIIKGVRGITRSTEERITNTRNYLRLKDINSGLSAENATLRNSIEKMIRYEDPYFWPVTDTVTDQQYEYTSAILVNNSVNRQKNFFTLSKGKKQGIDKDMAVVGPDGVVGLIVASSDNFSVAMSLLNIDFRLSSRIMPSGYFGSLAWDGSDYRYGVLNEIPQHVQISVGDTVETTSYSSVFPEGLMVGIISEYERSGSDFYRIRVSLSTNFRKLSHVNVIRNLKKVEQETLEKAFQ
jgi:rod shape-determining protein MreC